MGSLKSVKGISAEFNPTGTVYNMISDAYREAARVSGDSSADEGGIVEYDSTESAKYSIVYRMIAKQYSRKR